MNDNNFPFKNSIEYSLQQKKNQFHQNAPQLNIQILIKHFTKPKQFPIKKANNHQLPIQNDIGSGHYPRDKQPG